MATLAVSAPGQAPFHTLNANGVETYEGVRFYRTYLFRNALVGQKGSAGGRFKKIIAFPYFVSRLFSIGFRERPDVLHAHSMFYCGIAALIVGRLLGIPVVYEIRSLWYLNSNASLSRGAQRFFGWIETRLVRWADGVVVISAGLANWFAFVRNDLVIVRNAIFEQDIIREEQAFGGSVTEFGYVGSVTALEGLDFVIEAFARLRREGYSATLHIVGDGDVTDELKGQAKALAAPVVFHGSVPFEEVASQYASIDCIINYRRNERVAHEVTPLKTLEAAAFGKLVLCSEVGGMLEIMGGKENAIFVKPNDPEKLYQAILALHLGRVDTKIIKARATKFLLRHRTWEVNVELYSALYYKICGFVDPNLCRR
jgi:glycosyltransferase involved in cell wall biosynthesis